VSDKKKTMHQKESLFFWKEGKIYTLSQTNDLSIVMAFKESQYQWMSEATQIKGHEKTKQKNSHTKINKTKKKLKKGWKILYNLLQTNDFSVVMVLREIKEWSNVRSRSNKKARENHKTHIQMAMKPKNK